MSDLESYLQQGLLVLMLTQTGGEVDPVCLLSKADKAGLAKHWLWSRVEGGAVLCPLVGPSSLCSSTGWTCPCYW